MDFENSEPTTSAFYQVRNTEYFCFKRLISESGLDLIKIFFNFFFDFKKASQLLSGEIQKIGHENKLVHATHCEIFEVSQVELNFLLHFETLLFRMLQRIFHKQH